MIYKVYRTPGPPLKWWENALGFCVVWVILFVWIAGTLITRDGDWPDKWLKRDPSSPADP